MVVKKEVQIYPGFEKCVTQHQPKRTIENMPRHPLHLMVIAKLPSLRNHFTARQYPPP